ncbi:hypothetical protein Ga0609869_002892 [Rhodovulum iodosum]|uniref:DUF1311 domain-containing protein n=1 Tax=Rhodovulum iodosum TaxID=68291 RepID=A0ABV3XW39_9RHOB|nr:hypothetical protein [Rhodovulum robiginosum]RSK36460.1 hypothetical protein EJA01_05300 [Rhodovulum robiginosum]
MRLRTALGLAALLAGPVPAAAAEIDLPAVAACVEAHAAMGDFPAPCLAKTMAECRAIPPDSPALASQCFREARESWFDGIAAHMAEIRKTAPEEIAAIAGIELKYDLMADMTQCDRMEELALVGPGAAEDIQRQKDTCAAAAAGKAYIRLLWRSRNLQ